MYRFGFPPLKKGDVPSRDGTGGFSEGSNPSPRNAVLPFVKGRKGSFGFPPLKKGGVMADFGQDRGIFGDGSNPSVPLDISLFLREKEIGHDKGIFLRRSPIPPWLTLSSRGRRRGLSDPSPRSRRCRTSSESGSADRSSSEGYTRIRFP